MTVFLTVVKSGGYSVPPLSCLSLLSAGVRASQSGFDLHTHSGSVPAFTRPLKDDKIQCWMGAGSRAPAGCSLEDFNFVFHSLPFSSLSPTMFVHSCVHQCDYNRERSTFARTYVTDWLTDSAASIKSKMHYNCKSLATTGCGVHHHNPSLG